MTRLLVSVRNAEEAESACAGGADLIDVKEPARGSLGRADEQTIAQISARVAGRRPISVALGDLTPQTRPLHLPRVAFAKWGLAGCLPTQWQARLFAAAAALPAGCQPVVVAYADAAEADAPPLAAVLDFAATKHWPLLVDTVGKQGKSLLDWLSLDELGDLALRCRRAEIPLALAGSLSREQIERLIPLEPDWIAVRTAACRERERDGPICVQAVRALAEVIHGAGAEV
ncbi:MAG: (5-formylfuran-3-yl)methyl phosphate synthase [Gemmataceae bacterium]